MNITLQSASLDMVELTLDHSFHREEEDTERFKDLLDSMYSHSYRGR